MNFWCFLYLVASVYAGSKEIYNSDDVIKKVNSANATWKAGPNFASGTPLNYIKGLLGGIPNDKNDALPVKTWKNIPDNTVPKEFDARKKWPKCPSIRHIKDQGACGSCWAVASASVFADRVCIASNHTITKPYSAQELMSCCSECGYGCKGGSQNGAWSYFVKHGIVTGGDYHSHIGCQPYLVAPCQHYGGGPRPSCTSLPVVKTPKCVKKHCINPYFKEDFTNDHIKAKTAYTFNNLLDVQKEIMINGPVSAAYLVYEDFPSYKTGVYHQVTGKMLGIHIIRVIGWGEENKIPYWLVTNSWNKDWGANGLFKIQRGNDECGIEEAFTAGEIDTEQFLVRAL